MATASPGPGPVGYLVNHPGGLAGVQGIGYDYVLGSGGVYVQSESAHLTARVAGRILRGARPGSRCGEGGARPRPHPGSSSSRSGCAGSRTTPHTERFFAIRWDGRAYRLVVPEQEGTATSPQVHGPPPGVVAEFHSHGGSRAFFSKPSTTGDEQGFRIYGVAGRLDSDSATGAEPPGGGLRPLRPAGLAAGVRRPRTGRPADGRTAGLQRGKRKGGELRRCPTTWTTRSCWTTPGSPWWAAAGPGGFVAEGLCRLFQGRKATIVLVDHDRVEPHNLLRQNFYAEDVGKFKSQALADRLAQGLPKAGRLLGLPIPG